MLHWAVTYQNPRICPCIPKTARFSDVLTLSPPITTKVPYANSLYPNETPSNPAPHPDPSCLTLRHLYTFWATMKPFENWSRREIKQTKTYLALRVKIPVYITAAGMCKCMIVYKTYPFFVVFSEEDFVSVFFIGKKWHFKTPCMCTHIFVWP